MTATGRCKGLMIFRLRRKIRPRSGFHPDGAGFLRCQNSDVGFDIQDEEAMSDDEHRIAPRHRVLKGGSIQFGGGSIDCTVRNLSETGAALDVTSPLGIPSEFTLVTNGNQLLCRVVWRKEKRIGVTFAKDKSG
jgi:PilZ domain